MLLLSVVQMYAAAMLPNDSGSAVCCTDPFKSGGEVLSPEAPLEPLITLTFRSFRCAQKPLAGQQKHRMHLPHKGVRAFRKTPRNTCSNMPSRGFNN